MGQPVVGKISVFSILGLSTLPEDFLVDLSSYLIFLSPETADLENIFGWDSDLESILYLTC